MEIQKAIFRMEGLFNKSLADRVINYMNAEELKLLGTTGGKNIDVRNVKGFSVTPIFNLNEITNQDVTKYVLFNFIKKELDISLLNYTIKFPFCSFKNIIQTDFLKYSEKGKYEIHADDSSDTTRRITIIANLNDDYDGGDFIFFNPINKKDIIHREKLGKGTVLIFPSNFLYPHSVEPIIKGTRYSLVSWAL